MSTSHEVIRVGVFNGVLFLWILRRYHDLGSITLSTSIHKQPWSDVEILPCPEPTPGVWLGSTVEPAEWLNSHVFAADLSAFDPWNEGLDIQTSGQSGFREIQWIVNMTRVKSWGKIHQPFRSGFLIEIIGKYFSMCNQGLSQSLHSFGKRALLTTLTKGDNLGIASSCHML